MADGRDSADENVMTVGYARVSPTGRDLKIQQDALRNLGVDPGRIYTDLGFLGGALRHQGLDQAMAAARGGDRFVVSRLDRLAGNLEQVLEVMRELIDRKVLLQIGHETFDPCDPVSERVLAAISDVADAESVWASLRTKEALERPEVRAKMRGKQPRFKPSTDAMIAAEVELGERSISAIADAFGTSRSGIYRALSRHRLVSGEQQEA